MCTDKTCLNSVLGGPIKFAIAAQHEDNPPTTGAHNGCHGNACCSETGPQILQFMASFQKPKRP